MTASAQRHPSQVGFGCAHLMRVSRGKDRRLLLEEAFSAGIRHYDVARSYGLGATEADVGRFIRGKRDDVVIATKFGLPVPLQARVARFAQRPLRVVMSRSPRGRAAALRSPKTHASQFRFDARAARLSLETSLRQLGVDYIDLYLLHDPIKGTFRAAEVQDLMSQLMGSGRILAWGVAGEPYPMQGVLTELARADVVVQTRCDVLAESVPSLVRDADIVYGVLVSAMPAILRHLETSPGARRRWQVETGADCGDAQQLAALLLEDRMRARPGRTVLMSTTRRDRLGAVQLAYERISCNSGESCKRLRQLIAAEVGGST